MLQAIAPLIVNGLANAALIFFVAVGLTLVFSVLRVLNVAHGSFYSIGAYVAAVFGTWLLAQGISPYLTLPALLVSAIFVSVLLSPATERIFLRWTYVKPEALQILVTFALFLILEGLQHAVFGTQSYSESTPNRILGISNVFGVIYPNYQLALIGLAVVVVVGLRLLLRRSRFGKLVLTVVEDRELAQTLGINTNKVFMAAFTLGTFLAAFGGALDSATGSVSPGLGANTVVLAFAVATIGGLGQIEGAALAALIVGLGSVVAVFYAPALETIVPYIVMLVVLLIRPYGLLGSVKTRKI
jgi:branched-chain amino acid transport system permease protein